MGGYGSGRWGGHARRQTVEDGALRLPVADLKRAVEAHGPIGTAGSASGTMGWGTPPGARGHVGFDVAAVDYAGRRTLVLTYTATPRVPDGTATRAPADMRVFVPIIIERARLGGERWWLWCSACQRKRAAFYLALGDRVFRCRVCARLKYATQRADVVDRARIRAERVARRAGLDPDRLTRPKGMHRTRYARALAEHRAAEAEWDRRVGEALAGFALRRCWTSYDP